jgi:hypothetical protein
MFFAEGQIRVHLYGKPADMRKSYDGLQALARHAMARDPLDGSLYVFVNRRGTGENGLRPAASSATGVVSRRARWIGRD